MNIIILMLLAINPVQTDSFGGIIKKPVPSIQDMEFERIQIEWIAEQRTVHSLDEVLPWREAALIRQLDNNDPECRLLVEDELYRMGPKALTALLWGKRLNKKPHIVHMCNLLLGELYICPKCKKDRNYYCSECDGTRDMRYHKIYDPVTDDILIVPKNLFNPKPSSRTWDDEDEPG